MTAYVRPPVVRSFRLEVKDVLWSRKQLLEAWIVSHSIERGIEAQLVLVNPTGSLERMGEDGNGQSRLIYGQISPGKAFEHPWAHVFVGGFRNDLRCAPGFANGVVLATKTGVKLGCDHVPAGVKRTRLESSLDRGPGRLEEGASLHLIALAFINVRQHERFRNRPESTAIIIFRRVLQEDLFGCVIATKQHVESVTSSCEEPFRPGAGTWPAQHLFCQTEIALPKIEKGGLM